MPGPPPIPFFRTPTMSLVEANGTLRVVQGGKIKLAIAPWRIVEVTSGASSLSFRGAFSDLTGAPTEQSRPDLRVIDGLSTPDVVVAADALASRYDLPRPLTSVSAADIAATPQAFHHRYVELSGPWSAGFERNHFHGAWLYTALPYDRHGVTHQDITVRGIWKCDGDVDGYGHMGMSDAALYAVSAEVTR